MKRPAKIDANFDLKAEREALGLTQEQVADGIGVTQPTIGYWERGERKLRGPALILIKRYLKRRRAERARKAKSELPQHLEGAR